MLFQARFYLFTDFQPDESFELFIFVHDFIHSLLTKDFISISYVNLAIKIDFSNVRESFLMYLAELKYDQGMDAEKYIEKYQPQEELLKNYNQFLSENTLVTFNTGYEIADSQETNDQNLP